MDWLKQLTDLLGVSPQSFMAVTALVLVVVAVGRYVLGKKLEEQRWWKAVLTGTALALGVAVASLAQLAGVYKCDNSALVAFVGLFNGALAVVSHQLLKQIPWLDKWLRGITGIILIIGITGCGSWLNNTRAGILTANQALNSYDDLAVEIWKDAKEDEESKAELGVSLCASYIVQDALIEGWTIATMVDDGIKKKKDFTQWVGNILTVLDALENHIEMSGVKIPPQLAMLIAYVENLNPKALMDPSKEPLAECAQILPQAAHKAAGAFPYSPLIEATGQLALYLLNIIMDRMADKEIPEDALEQVLREVFKQETLYIEAISQPIGPDG